MRFVLRLKNGADHRKAVAEGRIYSRQNWFLQTPLTQLLSTPSSGCLYLSGVVFTLLPSKPEFSERNPLPSVL